MKKKADFNLLKFAESEMTSSAMNAIKGGQAEGGVTCSSTNCPSGNAGAKVNDVLKVLRERNKDREIVVLQPQPSDSIPKDTIP